MSSRLYSGNGRPEPEVIVNFNDGYSYSKGKLEEAFRSGGMFDKPQTKAVKDGQGVKKEDIELIVKEMEITRAQAERALADAKGNLSEALSALITPNPST